MRLLLIISFVVLLTNLRSQVNHYLGLNGGLTGFATVHKSQAPVFKLAYSLNYKPFLFVTDLNFISNSDFGNVIGGFIGVGFTSNIQKMLSVNLTYGLSKHKVGNSLYVAGLDQSGNPKPDQIYSYSDNIFNPYVTLGFNINPFKGKQFLIGLKSSLSKFTISRNSYYEVANPPYEVYHPAVYIGIYSLSYEIALNLNLSEIKK